MGRAFLRRVIAWFQRKPKRRRRPRLASAARFHTWPRFPGDPTFPSGPPADPHAPYAHRCVEDLAVGHRPSPWKNRPRQPGFKQSAAARSAAKTDAAVQDVGNKWCVLLINVGVTEKL